jgi:cystathionine beta-lyase
VAHDDISWKQLDRIPDETRFGRSIMGVAASIAAFDAGEPWLDDTISYLDQTRRYLGDRLAARLPGVGYTAPDATYLAWLDCRSLGLGDDPAAAFLDAGRVALYPGPRFGDDGRGFARLNFGTARSIVADAVDRMAGAVAAVDRATGPRFVDEHR